jgi:hypothetical protein
MEVRNGTIKAGVGTGLARMKIFDDLSARVVALLISAVSTVVTAGCSFLLTIFSWECYRWLSVCEYDGSMVDVHITSIL